MIAIPSTERLTAFKEQIFNDPDIVDPEGIHHEFTQGMHGRKVKFDKVRPGTSLYDEWIDLQAGTIFARHIRPRLATEDSWPRMVVLGIANGMNQQALDIAEALGHGVTGLTTVKMSKNTVTLDESSKENLLTAGPEVLQIVEDVGTAGTNAASGVAVARLCLATAGREMPRTEETLITVQRRDALERLDEIRAQYFSLFVETVALPTFANEAECLSIGHCGDGWDLVRHDTGLLVNSVINQ